MPITIFFCYARKDEALLNKLKAHLRPLQRQGLIDVWHDRDISAGSEWEQEIKQHLNEAQIVLLLISPDFMNSDYAYSVEMKQALERHERGETTVIPVILRPTHWHIEPLDRLQALPTDGQPVTSSYWHNLDTAFHDITGGIYKVVEKLTVPHAPAPSSSTEAIQQVAKASLIPPPVQSEKNFTTDASSSMIEKLALLRTLKGYTDTIMSVAISPDGQTLVSGNRNNTITVWELPTGREMRTLTGHTYSVTSVAISADGQFLVSGSKDRTVKVWKLSTGQEVRTLTGHTNYVTCVAISTDGQIIVSGSYDGTIRVWDISTGEEVHTFEYGQVTSVAISADGQKVAGGSKGRYVDVWDLRTGRGVAGVLDMGARNQINSVAFRADGECLFIGSQDYTIVVWKLSPKSDAGHIMTDSHAGPITSIAISADDRILVSGSEDKTVKVWNLSTKEVRTLTGHTRYVTSVAISKDGHTIVSGSADRTIKVWGYKEF